MRRGVIATVIFCTLLLAGCSVNNQSKVSNNDNKVTKVSKKESLDGRGFMSPSTDSIENGIAFKGDKFIWKYGYPVSNAENSGIFALLTGNYRVEGKNILMYNIKNTNFYQGTLKQLSKNQYTFSSNSNIVPKKLRFKLSKNNKLHLMTKSTNFGTIDMLDYGTVSGTPNYKKWSKDYAVDDIDNEMQKVTPKENNQSTVSQDNQDKDENTDESSWDDSDFSDKTHIYNLKDFQKFIEGSYLLNGDSDTVFHYRKGEFNCTVYSNDEDLNDDSTEDVTAHYKVYWQDPDDTSITNKIIVAENGYVYMKSDTDDSSPYRRNGNATSWLWYTFGRE